MTLFKGFNIVFAILFIVLIFAGSFETQYETFSYNITGFFMMFFGGMGLLSQFILLNVILANKAKKNT